MPRGPVSGHALGRHDETDAIGRSHFAAAPGLRQGHRMRVTATAEPFRQGRYSSEHRQRCGPTSVCLLAVPSLRRRVHTDVLSQIIASIQVRQDYAPGSGRLGIRCHVKHLLANAMSCGAVDEFVVGPIVTIGVTRESLACNGPILGVAMS